MACTLVNNGIICSFSSPVKRLRLEDGSYIFMEWHNYAGPIFFKDKKCTKEIEDWYENPLLIQVSNWFIKRGKKC